MAVELAQTRERFRSAVESRDHGAVVSLFAPDVILHSPIVGSPAFEGREAVGDLMGAVLATFEDIRYTGEGELGDVEVLRFRARVRGREIETVDLMHMNDDGLVDDVTVVIRPMAGLAAVAAALGPRIARGPVQAVLIRLLSAPLALLLGVAERVSSRLVRMQSG